MNIEYQEATARKLFEHGAKVFEISKCESNLLVDSAPGA